MRLPALAGYRATPVTGGASGGVVHRLEAPGRATLYRKAGEGRVADDITDEAVRLLWLRGRMPVPALVHLAREPDRATLLSTALPGETIDATVARDPTCLPTLLPSLAAFLRRLHALPVDSCPFDASAPVRLAAAHANLAAGRVDTGDFGPDHAGWSATQVWDAMVAHRPPAVERVVTHGDYSLGNLLVEDGQVTGIIDVGRAGVADPYQDLAILWLNLEEVGAGLGDRFLAAYGIAHPDRARLAFHLSLDEFF